MCICIYGSMQLISAILWYMAHEISSRYKIQVL